MGQMTSDEDDTKEMKNKTKCLASNIFDSVFTMIFFVYFAFIDLYSIILAYLLLSPSRSHFFFSSFFKICLATRPSTSTERKKIRKKDNEWKIFYLAGKVKLISTIPIIFDVWQRLCIVVNVCVKSWIFT